MSYVHCVGVSAQKYALFVNCEFILPHSYHSNSPTLGNFAT